MKDQFSYVAEVIGKRASGKRNFRFEISPCTTTALFCPFATRTSDLVCKLLVSRKAIPTFGGRKEVKLEKLRRVSKQISVNRTDDGIYSVALTEPASMNLKSSLSVDVWSNLDDEVRVFDRIDALGNADQQFALNGIVQEAEESPPTSVIVTRRLEIAEICRHVVYIENERPYAETLNQGRKSFVTHLQPDDVVRKFYNKNGDRLTKSLREIGFYLHYGQSEAIPNLIDYSVPSHISIGYLSGQSIDQVRFTDDQSKIDLTRRFAHAVIALFGDAKPISDDLKSRYYGGAGANANIEAVLRGLQALGPHYKGCDPFHELVAKVEKIHPKVELLIKLDWNSSNTIISRGGQFGFIDFEQAFIGTREMLAGILLHNPVWCARTLIHELRDQSLFSLDDDELSNMVHFALAYVLIDSVSRSGSPWSRERFVSAYQRHVTERLFEVGDH